MKIEQLEVLSQVIRKNLNNVMNLYFQIGESLALLENEQGYKCKNYEDIYHFADVELKLDKSKTSRLISIFRKFGNDRVTYEKYTYSQLREMLGYDDKELKLCNPSMTVKEIIAIKLKKDTTPSEVTKQQNETKTIKIETEPNNQEVQKLNQQIEMLQLQIKDQEKSSKPENKEALEIEQLRKDVDELKNKIKNTDSFMVYMKNELKTIKSVHAEQLLIDLDNYITTGSIPNKIKLLNAV